MNMKKISKINQLSMVLIGGAVLLLCLCAAVTGILGMAGTEISNRNDTEITSESFKEENMARKNSPKYILNDPVSDMEKPVTSDVTEESETRKSNRLEDIVGVLSDVLEEK